MSAFQSSSSVSQNTVIKDDRSEDSENEEKKLEFLRLPKTEKDTTIAYPRYPRPLRTELFQNATYMKVRTTTSKSIGNIVIRRYSHPEKYEMFPRDSISTQRVRSLYNHFCLLSHSSSFAIDLDSDTRVYAICIKHSLMVLTDESNYANARIQLLRLRNKKMLETSLSCLFKEIFQSSSSSKKRRKSELKTPLKLPDVGIRYDGNNFDDSKLWMCSTCSLMNSVSRQMCAGCHSSQRLASKVIDSSSQRWSCGRCSTLNPVSAKSCKNCESRRKSRKVIRIRPTSVLENEDEEISLLKCGQREKDLDRQYRDTQHLWVQLVNFNPYEKNPPRPHCAFCKLERKFYMQNILRQLFLRVKILLVLTSKRRSVENRMRTMIMCLDRMEKHLDASCREKNGVVVEHVSQCFGNVDVFEEEEEEVEEHMLNYNRFAGLGHIFRLICSYQVRHFTQPLRARAVRVMTRTSEDVRQILTTRIAEYVFGPPPKSECTARPEELSTTPLPLVCSRVAPPILVAAVNAMLSGRSVRVVVVVNRLYKSCVVTLTNVNHCKHTHRYCS